MDATGSPSDNDWTTADGWVVTDIVNPHHHPNRNDMVGNGAHNCADDYVASWPQPSQAAAPTAMGAIAIKWAALHQAAQVVAAIAGTDDHNTGLNVRAFPAIIREVGGWQCRLAEQGIDDLTAIMEAGLCALLCALDRGADPRAAARSLWEEFVTARDAVVALAPSEALLPTEHSRGESRRLAG
ncbi:hypothetical protein [Novosphingobium clariflavum]|uniref:Uncharacterized protein n=1 Tax=Novosphingobium clariflavum TaxID=2029884 RepID=A0ABV6S4S2_9SPHN|nr:hypothetical protein [Novosphingobium clariflavum]